MEGLGILGTTVGASMENLSFCGATIRSPGVWYSLATENETSVQVGLCEETTYSGGLDGQISVFEGSCANLICVGGNNEFCGAFQWDAKAGVTYYILVSWFGLAVVDTLY